MRVRRLLDHGLRGVTGAMLLVFALLKLTAGLRDPGSVAAWYVVAAIGELALAILVLWDVTAPVALAVCWWGFVGAGIGTLAAGRHATCACLGPSLHITQSVALLLEGLLASTAGAAFLNRSSVGRSDGDDAGRASRGGGATRADAGC